MADMLDYLAWRGDIEFTQIPVNPVDALIFSTLSYIDFKDIVPDNPMQSLSMAEAAAGLFSLSEPQNRTRVKKDLVLLEAVAGSARFDNIRLSFYRSILIPEEDTQFAAMTIFLEDGSAYIAFRGTDSTLTGWKEDFNMTFQTSIPAQRLALEYVQEFAEAHPIPIWMGGHSKGGNLAVYAAAKCGELLQKRIVEVHNQDGPGFSEAMMNDPGYRAILPKLRSYVPQSSVIGMLLEHEEPYTVIRSKSVGVLQHDLYNWDVLGKDFISVEEITEGSQFVDATIKTWFADMTNQERNQLVDVLYGLLSTGGVENVQSLLHPKNIRTYIRTLSSDENLRRILSTEFTGLIEAARKTKARFDEKRETDMLIEGEKQ